ncbi:MAG TPA: NrsF family protein [Steroidobacteraceae bacterium]|jgi:hypothetical protein
MQTDKLIESLAQQLTPVRPLRAPLLRALLWLGVVAAVGAALIAYRTGLHILLPRIAQPRVAVQCAATALTAITAIVAAFELSVPGRDARWAWAPVPPFLVWLAASGLGCLQNGLSLHQPGGMAGESPGCFGFITAVSVPLALGLFWMLRRARPIAPLPVATLGTLGVAATAAFVLEFFHPFDVTVIDLAFHMAAVALVVIIGISIRRVLLAVD